MPDPARTPLRTPAEPGPTLFTPHPGPESGAQLLLRVDDVATRLSLSRATVNRLLATGALPSVKLGRARRVVARDLEQFVDDLAHGHLHLGGDAPHGGAR